MDEMSDKAERLAAAKAAGRIPTSGARYALMVVACVFQALVAVFTLILLVDTTMNSTSGVGTKAVVFVVMVAVVLAFTVGTVTTARSLSRRAIV
ncbi:hypothetical protein BH683_018420 [Williamsia sp. 1138]|uniref:hypothetical protein n=1 Tax=Williamsia sp. 1138 TaxID=1903117 RepID=UPI000A0FA30C|nr:hypothetical protein [Williamsia sp. 1138]OZG27829.1 hypothetical protein BH683_018420 [Williamsia sp. 1138]